MKSFKVLFVAVAALVVFTACEPVYTEAAIEHQETSTDDRPWWCDSTGGGHGDHEMHHDPYEGIVKGELSWNDCITNSVHFDMLNDWALQWTSEGVAEDAGFFQVVPYAKGMGTHHLNPDGQGGDGIFDPANPDFIMFDGNNRGAQLTGFAWWVRSDGAPPEGFRGDNDWWHQHPNVCLSPNGKWRGQGGTREACESGGGEFLPNDDMWMTHAWILPNWQIEFDVFQNHHPCLPGSGPITDPADPCWMTAKHGEQHHG